MVRPKKHLGQHFLKEEHVANRIVDAISLTHPVSVIEVGPGTGVLTKYLLERYPNFSAFDVDEESIAYLKKHYPDHEKCFVLRDFLKESISAPGTVVIGNFPYNISSQLFFKVWDNHDCVSEVVCMVQKEVAERICAQHGSKTYGILSVLLQTFFIAEYLFSVPPGAFHPPPKVVSGVMRLKRNDVTDIGCDIQKFKAVVKSAFGKRRKTLRNAIKDLALPAHATNIPLFDKRAEQLSVSEFVYLTKYIEQWSQS